MIIGQLLAILIAAAIGYGSANDDTCKKGQEYTADAGSGQNFKCTEADRAAALKK